VGGDPSRSALLVAAIAGITGVGGSYAVAGYTRRFVVAPIDAAVVRLTPGEVVAFVIQTVGEPGHLLHVVLSVGITIALLAGAALVGLHVVRRYGRPLAGVAIAGLLAWSLAVLVTRAPVLALGAAGPVLVSTAIGATPFARPDHEPSRRRVLLTGAGAVAVVGGSVASRRLVDAWNAAEGDAGGSTDSDAAATDEEVAALTAEADEKSLDVRGEMPGLVSTFEEFYNVDIAEFDPDLSPEEWSLAITGQVGEEVSVRFEELTDLPTERRFLTLRCVGETLNGHKMDTAVWTGTPIKPLLEAADPAGECGCAMLHAADGYSVQFPIEALADGFLAWGMNGLALPQSHGHPVRVLIPGHWGETNVKWLEEIELLDEEMDGYWEQRGWHGTGPVNTVAKLWSDTTVDDGRIEVAGHAYAGTRGIERVEVSTDGGHTWGQAELSDPLPGEDVWRQWRYVFDPDGAHEVTVRAVDGQGTLQPEERSDAFPSGATGWVTETVGE